MANQICGGIIMTKAVAEEVYNELTHEVEARGWVRLTIGAENAEDLSDAASIMEGEVGGRDSFDVFVSEGTPAFKKLTRAAVVSGARIIMSVISATRNADGFESLNIGAVGIDDEDKYSGFFKAPEYVDVVARERSRRVIHYM